MSIGWPVAQIESQKRRLEILRFLNCANGFLANTEVLRPHLYVIGVPTNTDQIAACAEWLSEQGLVVLTHTKGQHVLRLTPDGKDTAAGLRNHPGVMQPEP